MSRVGNSRRTSQDVNQLTFHCVVEEEASLKFARKTLLLEKEQSQNAFKNL